MHASSWMQVLWNTETAIPHSKDVIEEKTVVFEYTWKIDNHNLLEPFKAIVESPEFEILTFPQIKFHLGYAPKSAHDSLSVFLKRSDNDNGPPEMNVTYSVSVLRENGSVIHTSEAFTFPFRTGSSKMYTIEQKDENQLIASNTLILKCTFFTSAERKDIELHDDVTILSNDIKSLFTNEILWDITLKESNSEFRAHKSILWARCPELITNQNPENILGDPNVVNIQPDEMRSFLQDIYSGSLNTFKCDAPLVSTIQKYELILQGRRSVQSLQVCSTVQTNSVSQIWSFDVNQFNNKKKLFTPILVIKGNEFKLVVQLTNDTGHKTMELWLRCVSTKTPNPVYLQYTIKLLGAKEEFCTSSSHFFKSGEDHILPLELGEAILRTTFFAQTQNAGHFSQPRFGGNKLQISKFPFVNQQQTTEKDHHFRLECTLSISDGRVLCTSEIWNSKPLSTETDYKILSDDLLNLYKSKEFSDVSLLTGGEIFSAHKAILAARSPVFFRMFQANMAECLSNEVKIMDIEPKIVESLLKYIYTGRGKMQNVEDVMQLYAAADKYEFLNLKQNCASLLESNLKAENVGEILILADMHQDEKLKNTAQTFICNNADIVLVSNEWKNVVESRIDLATEILHKLSIEFAQKRNTDL